MKKIKQFDHSIYRLIIRNIDGFGTFQKPILGVKRVPNLCPELDQLKSKILDRLIAKESTRKSKLINWSIAWETHSSGLPHFDILLVYQKNIQFILTSFDYLIKDLNIKQHDVGDDVGIGHVWITPYSPTKLSKAILDYGQKEDPNVLTNLSSQSKEDLLRVTKLKADPYRYLELQMDKDPIYFNLEQYVKKHNLAQYISSWSSIKSKLKDMQIAAANLKLKDKPGFKFIDRSLIQSRLTPSELVTYDSWSGYQTIVNYLNQIMLYGTKRSFKSKQLLLVGRPNTGKTSLVNLIQQFLSVYHLDVSNWFPNYRDGVYRLLFWDQFKLKGGMSHTDLLKFLQGSPMDLQYKGGSSLRMDNQLIIMTSNMTLNQHIEFKFKDITQRFLARQNLSVRIQEVIIPNKYDLFLLLRLILGK